MSQRVHIRISYGTVLEHAEAEHASTGADGVEVYRVWRQGRIPGEPVRDDMLRLRKQEGDAFDFVGSADPARPETTHLSIASRCLGMPASNEFKRRLDERACVLESQWSVGGAFYLVFSHATDVPIHEWHVEMLRDTIGVLPDELTQYLRDETRSKERQRARREKKQTITRAVWAGSRLVVSVAVIALVLGLVGGGAAMFIGVESGLRPRVAAMGMLASLIPSLFTREGRGLWPLLLLCAAGGVGALVLLDRPIPSYGVVTALGAIYAVVIGLCGVLTAMVGLLLGNARQRNGLWTAIALPALGSAISAVALAVTSAAAAGSRGGLGSGVRTVAIGVTALLLFGPVTVFFSNAAAVLGGKAWRRNPKLQVGALVMLPLTMIPVVLRVAVPIAVIWGIVWLVRR